MKSKPMETVVTMVNGDREPLDATLQGFYDNFWADYPHYIIAFNTSPMLLWATRPIDEKITTFINLYDDRSGNLIDTCHVSDLMKYLEYDRMVFDKQTRILAFRTMDERDMVLSGIRTWKDVCEYSRENH